MDAVFTFFTIVFFTVFFRFLYEDPTLFLELPRLLPVLDPNDYLSAISR